MLRVIFASFLDAFLASLLFLSLSQFTSLESSLFFFVALRALDRVHFERARARPRVYVVVHGRALVCFVFKFHFQFHFAFRSDGDGE